MKKLIIFFVVVVNWSLYGQSPCPDIPTVTYAGKTYNTVQIGKQCWLKENLDIGTMILNSVNQINNSSIEKYCYNNDVNNCAIYGGLYMWAEAVQYKNGAENDVSPNPLFTGNIQGICPAGWHIPSYYELQTLGSMVANNSNALKVKGDGSTSDPSLNSSGFSALLGGYRFDDKTFNYLGIGEAFWSSTESDRKASYNMNFSYANSTIYFKNYNKEYAFSVRCIKNDTGTSVNNEKIPFEYSLFQNYPNPFNPTTVINYQLPAEGFVTIKVYDILGKEVVELVNENKAAGYYPVNFDASKLASGIYIYSINAGSFSMSKKMILTK